MPSHGRRRSTIRILLAVVALSATFAGWLGTPSGSSAALPRWTGGVDLYRSGTFTTQQSWLWCTAADVQIVRNIVDRRRDHSTASQQRYFAYMRARNRYDIPVTDGVDPAGWTRGLRHYVDGRYRLVANRSFDAALRSAVTNLRKTGLPVGITVAHGNHAWVLTGFDATADPATTSEFTVTSVRVVGPLWGLQSRSYGYDMRPNRTLAPEQLRRFFTPWHYARVKMAWEGRWVSIQPIARAAKATSKPGSTPKATRSPAPSPRATASPTPEPTELPATSPAPTASATASDVAVAVAVDRATPSAEAAIPGSTASTTGSVIPSMVLALVSVVALLGALAVRWRADRPRAPR